MALRTLLVLAALVVVPCVVASDVVGAWASYADDEGQVYYHNEGSGETTWDKPEGFVEVADDNEDAGSEDDESDSDGEQDGEQDDEEDDDLETESDASTRPKERGRYPLDHKMAKMKKTWDAAGVAERDEEDEEGANLPGRHVPENCGDEDCLIQVLRESTSCSDVLTGDGTEEIFFVFRGYQTGYGQSQKILIDQAPNGHPAKMPFGKNSLLDGMESGMMGMCVGEQRKLWIPPKYAYAAAKFDNNPKISHIARDRDVEYEVQLVHIQRQGAQDVPEGLVGMISFCLLAGIPALYCFASDGEKKSKKEKWKKKSKKA